MTTSNLEPKLKPLQGSHVRLGAVRFSRAYALTIDALQTLCCGSGGMKNRLQQVDPEFYSLNANDLPDENGVRDSFLQLRELVTQFEPRWSGDGRVAAGIDQMHHTKRSQVSQLIWNIHRDFSRYMQGDA